MALLNYAYQLDIRDSNGLPLAGLANVELRTASLSYVFTGLGNGVYRRAVIPAGRYMLWINGVSSGQSYAVGAGELAGLGHMDGSYLACETNEIKWEPKPEYVGASHLTDPDAHAELFSANEAASTLETALQISEHEAKVDPHPQYQLKEDVADHESLNNLYGGLAGDHWHLTQDQHTDLTDAGDSALHHHAADRDRANHTGTQLANTISNFASTVLGTLLTGLTAGTDTVILATNSILTALQNLQAQVSNRATLIHASRHSAGGDDAVSIDTSQISNMSAFMRTVNDDASAADARNTLDTPPKNHASASTDFGAAGEINYGHVQKENTVTNGSLKVPTSNAVYAAILANKFVDQNSGTYGNGVLVGEKGGYAGLTAAGQKRIVFMSAGYETGCGLYNETDGKWLIKFDGQSGLVTDYNPVADANTNLLANTGWVLSRLADTKVGNADKVDGYHIVYTTYAGKGSASDTFYFTFG